MNLLAGLDSQSETALQTFEPGAGSSELMASAAPTQLPSQLLVLREAVNSSATNSTSEKHEYSVGQVLGICWAILVGLALILTLVEVLGRRAEKRAERAKQAQEKASQAPATSTAGMPDRPPVDADAPIRAATAATPATQYDAPWEPPACAEHATSASQNRSPSSEGLPPPPSYASAIK